MVFKQLSPSSRNVFMDGGVFVPCPLALDHGKNHHESYQRLLTLYYIESGAKAVIPGAHTGEFALNDLQILGRWMLWTKEMVQQYGSDMVLMAMVGGPEVMKQAELAAHHDYHAVMVAPTAYAGKTVSEILTLFESIASVIPTFAFELQRAIPGSHSFSYKLWDELFNLVYGAKGASFDTYRSLVMLEAAARSSRKDELILFTGNDDRIVSDLLSEYMFSTENGASAVIYRGGLLGHFATDTKAAVTWVDAIKARRGGSPWDFGLSEGELAHGVNRCNLALFDALGNFENSVWGVKYRLASMGLLPGAFCVHEKGREGQGKAISIAFTRNTNY